VLRKGIKWKSAEKARLGPQRIVKEMVIVLKMKPLVSCSALRSRKIICAWQEKAAPRRKWIGGRVPLCRILVRAEGSARVIQKNY